MLDLAVTGGTVVTGTSAGRADIGVRDGRVAILAEPGHLPDGARQSLDATGMYVLPGGIDAHVHFNIAVTDAMRAQTAVAGSRASAFGGTTTFIDFAFQSGDGSPVEAVAKKSS